MGTHSIHRILVVSNETVEGDTLHELLERRSTILRSQVIVVAPALNSRLRHWVSDEDDARHAAEERLGRSLARLQAAGIRADGWVGDADPMVAIDDALVMWDADEVVIATHPEHRSNWLARKLVQRVRLRYDAPVTHVVVDRERELVPAAA